MTFTIRNSIAAITLLAFLSGHAGHAVEILGMLINSPATEHALHTQKKNCPVSSKVCWNEAKYFSAKDRHALFDQIVFGAENVNTPNRSKFTHHSFEYPATPSTLVFPASPRAPPFS